MIVCVQTVSVVQTVIVKSDNNSMSFWRPNMGKNITEQCIRKVGLSYLQINQQLLCQNRDHNNMFNPNCDQDDNINEEEWYYMQFIHI